MPPKIDQSERRREVTQAAIRILGEAGSRGLTLRALAEELGGSVRLVTHFFPNRHALLDAITRQMIEDETAEVVAMDAAPGLTDLERLRRFMLWLLPTSAREMMLERSRVMMSAETEAHFNIQKFFDAWEESMRALIGKHVAPLVPKSQLAVYVDLMRVLQNGVVLSSVEHPNDWPSERQAALVDLVLTNLFPAVSRSGTRARKRH
jgi:AcrR family transcriptional regulator